MIEELTINFTNVFFNFNKVVSINEEGLRMTEELTKETGHPIR